MKIRIAKLFLVLALAAVICLPAVASATVLNFDDISNPTGSVAMPETYGGFTWSGEPFDSSVVTQASLNNTGSSFPSGLNAVRSSASSITSTTPFIFEGAYFGTMKQFNYNQQYGATSVTITGYLEGNFVGAQTIDFPLTADGAAYSLIYTSVDLGGAVDKLVFTDTWPNMSSYAAGYFLMDNFTYEAAPVPIPPSAMLLGSGLLGLVGLRRFRKS